MHPAASLHPERRLLEFNTFRASHESFAQQTSTPYYYLLAAQEQPMSTAVRSRLQRSLHMLQWS